MTNDTLEQLKYPIGKFKCPANITAHDVKQWIDVLETFPLKFEKLVSNLTDTQLDTPYRPEGWTVRQVVHHVADSHHHSYIRFKWAMTEDHPTIKAYNEQAWAAQQDYNLPITLSLHHISVVHQKLVNYVKGLSFKDLERTFYHPESKETVSLKQNLGIYAWHSNHHFAHIAQLIENNFKF